MRPDADPAALCRGLTDPLPHPDPAASRAAGRAALDWALDPFAQLSDLPVGREAGAAELAALLSEPPPEDGRDFAAAFAAYREWVAPYAFHIDHPRFLAFIPAAPTVPAVLGELLCAATNPFAGVWREAAGPAQVERVVLDWFKGWLGYPAHSSGILTGGGSEANLTALAVARHPVPFADRGRTVLYVSGQRHASVDRAAMVLGLRPDQVRPVPDDADLRLTPAALGEAVRRDRTGGLLPWAVVANGGATNTGTVDPLGPLADLCAAERLWLHADAAYGWSAVLTAEGRAELAGIDRADSVTLDPHKWLAQPYDAGGVLGRGGGPLPAAVGPRPGHRQDVFADPGEINFADCGLALPRRFRALKVWLSVQTLGVGWFRQLVDRCLRLAGYAEAVLRAT